MDAHELAFAGAAEQARMLADGAITAPELIEVYLERIERIDPQLRSYRVVLGESARAEAAAAQARLDAGERLPLLGVPIAIKDDVDVGGEVTTYGTAAHGPAPAEDAEVVRRLRAAGAVIVGSTNMSEFAFSGVGFNPHYGTPGNPYDRRADTGRIVIGCSGVGERWWRPCRNWNRYRRLGPHPGRALRDCRL